MIENDQHPEAVKAELRLRLRDKISFEMQQAFSDVPQRSVLDDEMSNFLATVNWTDWADDNEQQEEQQP